MGLPGFEKIDNQVPGTVYIYVCMYVCIYIYRERERLYVYVCVVYVCRNTMLQEKKRKGKNASQGIRYTLSLRKISLDVTGSTETLSRKDRFPGWRLVYIIHTANWHLMKFKDRLL